MLLFQNDFQVHAKEIRGVQYVVFSIYEGGDLLLDHIGNLIQNAYETQELSCSIELDVSGKL